MKRQSHLVNSIVVPKADIMSDTGDKGEIVRCPTAFPRSSDLNSQAPRVGEVQSKTNLLRKRKLTGQNHLPPPLPLAVNPTVSSLTTKQIPEQRAYIESSSSKNPWASYEKLCQDDQAGPTYTAFLRSPPNTFVAIKEYSRDKKDQFTLLTKTAHSNLVNLKEVFASDNTFIVVCEYTDISLADVLSTPKAVLTEITIATILREVSCYCKIESYK